MKNLLIVLLMLTTSLLTAQNIITWNGGTPGKETKWTESKNWSGQQVPDEFSIVIIKQMNTGHNAQPVIDTKVEVTALEIHNGACLTISETGILEIEIENSLDIGLSNFGGTLINEGMIQLKESNEIRENKVYAIGPEE